MPVQFPSLVVVKFGVGRFLLTKAKVAASLAPPHSILNRCSVSTVKRALPTCTTASGLGPGSCLVAEVETVSGNRTTNAISQRERKEAIQYITWLSACSAWVEETHPQRVAINKLCKLKNKNRQRWVKIQQVSVNLEVEGWQLLAAWQHCLTLWGCVPCKWKIKSALYMSY